MCGITGFVADDRTPAPLDMVLAAVLALRHRGPDDEGLLYLRPDGSLAEPGFGAAVSADIAVAALAHSRLSILDPSPAGHQPMRSADGQLALVLNGEIYNFLELRDELESIGHVFRTRSDTEVLLAAWSQWGAAVLPRLVGMFAFAMADFTAGTVTLARDLFGIKPLYYAWQGGTLLFASEIGALLEVPGVGRQLDAQALYDYLRYGLTDHGEATLISGVRAVPPGGMLEVPIGRPRHAKPVAWGEIEVTPRSASDIGFDEAAKQLQELFLGSVQVHLRSDVPLGVALSGGIDSSSSAMAMRRLLGSEPTINAFGYVADTGAPSEERWMEIVATAGSLALHRVHICGQEMTEDLDRFILLQDMPVASTSMYAQFRVFQAAHAAGVKVMIDGQGADEYLAGYPTFAGARLASLLAAGRIGESLSFLMKASHSTGLGRFGLLARAGRFFAPRAAAPWLRPLAGEHPYPRWMDRKWFADRSVCIASDMPARGTRKLIAYLEECLTRRSLPALLRYADRNSMAHSVESRVPFLTKTLVEFTLSLPEEYILAADGTTKAVFRRAMRGIVPDAVLDRRDRVGFITPQNSSLIAQPSWVEAALAAGRRLPALRIDELISEWRRCRAAGKRLPAHLWRVANLVRWMDLRNLDL